MGGTRNRITGMYSGLDTESLISQLVEARKTKVTTAQKDQMNIKYKQDAWNDLNKKLKSFQKSVENLRFKGSYTKRTTNVSDPKYVSVMSSDSAMLATQELEVTNLAKAAYLTGNKITYAPDGQEEKATSGTLLSSLGISGGTLSITNDATGEASSITIAADETLGSLAQKMADAGVAANFDTATQRFFVGAKSSGADGNFSLSASDDILSKLGIDSSAKYIPGENAQISLNGVNYDSSNNNFEINGLTITAKAVTDGEKITLETVADTSAIYDMIKDVVKQYTELINEMDKFYNAQYDKNYKPLTDEEKSAMSEYEIKKWDEKIKDQILAKDENLSTISSALSGILNAGVEINGKKMFLHDFGIETGEYLTTPANEKHALHIYGDEDDEEFSSKNNILKNMILTDPDTVTDFFSKLSDNLFTKMQSMSARVKETRSYGYFFDDIKMKNDYASYTTKIAELEKQLQQYEDKWYDKFSKMETAMAKMQSSQNAVSSLLGTSI